MIKELLKKLRIQKKTRLYRSGWLDQSMNGNFTPIDTLISYGSLFSDNSGTGGTQTSLTKSEKKEDYRIEKLPIEVYKEIFQETPAIDCLCLDSKIKLVEKRIKVLKSVGIENQSNELEALDFLKARKKYLKYINLFRWETTNDTLIKNLCSKYKVAMVDFASYQRNVPAEAIDELDKFMDAYSKVRDDEPILKLIIDDKPKSVERKKDPILLASSPFGTWFYVLGAWDKEVEIIDDIIYHKK